LRSRCALCVLAGLHDVYDLDNANWLLDGGCADLVAFGRPFVANPDLPYRLAQGLTLAAFDGAALFGGSEHGYTDYQTARECGRQRSAPACRVRRFTM
jgi:2,4-dienoyl-CoA reductase-like NADH-dependent reductase (Old Yellow Enzyme family)